MTTVGMRQRFFQYAAVFFLLVGSAACFAAPGASRLQNPAAPGSQSASSRSLAANKITSYTLPPELFRKAQNRGRISFATRIVGIFYGIFVLYLILARGLSSKYRDWAERVSGKRFVQAFVFTPALLLSVAILDLPLGIFREWLLKTYKISVQTWPSWAADWLKEQLLVVLIGSLLVWGFYAVIRKSPRRWWLYAWLGALPILVFAQFVSPYVVEPMFYEFAPLASKAPALIPAIQKVMHKAGEDIPGDHMFWMKASDKTIATNAYVSGFGASKRVVIWDTTLAQETDDEVLMDFGHELGHYVLGHLWKGLLFFAGILLALLYLAYRSVGWVLAKRGKQWGIRGIADWASLPALLLLFSVFGIIGETAGNAFSRYLENQADIYSLEINHGIIADPGQAMARGFQKFGESVLEDPKPNRLRVFLFYDHPPVSDRVHLFVTYDPWSKGEPPRFVK